MQQILSIQEQNLSHKRSTQLYSSPFQVFILHLKLERISECFMSSPKACHNLLPRNDITSKRQQLVQYTLVAMVDYGSFLTHKDCGWCNLHNAGCIIQVAGHVLWPRAAWLYQEAVTHRRLTFLCQGGLQIIDMREFLFL